MKIFKWIAFSLVTLTVLLFAGYKYMIYNTKLASPEKSAEYSYQNAKISVFYCSPAKKGRIIFGDLVPFEKVWRTGANEATTITSATDFVFGETKLPAGTYSLWTIPGPADWTIILNSKMYDWGVDFDGPTRDPAYDVALFNAISIDLEEVVEDFTIRFEYDVNLVLEWDKTKVMVPLTLSQ